MSFFFLKKIGDTPDDEQQACSKHVGAYYWNKLIENSASCWFILCGYITMHSQQNFKNENPLLFNNDKRKIEVLWLV